LLLLARAGGEHVIFTREDHLKERSKHSKSKSNKEKAKEKETRTEGYSLAASGNAGTPLLHYLCFLTMLHSSEMSAAIVIGM
jgi:hypothetical protein